MKTTLLLCLFAMSAAAVEPSPWTAMVWGGGATRADADASLVSFEARQKSWEGAVALAAGFPQVVESKTIAGMKPGFVVVLLGYCSDTEAAPALELLKQFDTSIYSRPVQSGGASCPKLAAGFVRVDARSVKTKEGELLGLFLTREGSGMRLLLQHRSRAGALIESPVISPAQLSEGQEECTLSLAREGIAVAFDCRISRGSCGDATVIGERRYGIKSGKIAAQYVKVSSDFPPCNGGD